MILCIVKYYQRIKQFLNTDLYAICFTVIIMEKSNRADSDAWDCFAPGYSFRRLQIGKRYIVKDILGYYHKIAIRVNF